MKTSFPRILLTLCFGMLLSPIQGQNYQLNVQDPQSWGIQPANIDSATIVIRPKGVYSEIGLYLTFSAKGSSWYGQANPPLEIVMDFCLPKGSIIHDSWLWVGNDIMQAILIDREVATQIYEGIVDRRKDPSILSKKSDHCYELRVYPLSGDDTRKVKITYLVPAHWTQHHVSSTLPLNVLRLSNTIPDLQLQVYTDSTFTNPIISELGFLPFTGSSSPYGVTIPASAIQTYSSLDISYDSPMQNGIFTGTYPTAADQGYFQFVMNPRYALGAGKSRNLAVMLEYESGNGTVQQSELIAKTKEMLIEYLSPEDSFNLFYGTSTGVGQANSNWMAATQQNINNVFAFLPHNISLAPYLGSYILSVGSFVKSQGTRDILLITNREEYHSYYNYGSDTIIDDIVQHLDQQIKVNVVDYFESSYYGYYQQYSNFYQKVCNRTGGDYISGMTEYWDEWGYSYYQNRIISFSEILREMFVGLDQKITNYSFHAEMDPGICYAEYELNSSNSMSYNTPYKVVGKYYGQGDLVFQLSAIIDANLKTANWHVSQAYQGDSMLRKIWAGSFIKSLDGNGISNQIKREIIDTSMSCRVLSNYTAFLALEPNDTLFACENCTDESNSGPFPVGVEEESSTEPLLAAFPNPFISDVKISMMLHKENRDAELHIYNLTGQLVKTFIIDQSEGVFTITWRGDDDRGLEVSDGIYIAVFFSAKGKHIVKLVKASN